MNPEFHPNGELYNIQTGQLAHPDVNVDRAPYIGKMQLKQFESSWPDGFYNPISRDIIIFAQKEKHLKVGDNIILDQESIYAHIIGLPVSDHKLDLTMCFLQNLQLTHQHHSTLMEP